MKVITTSLLLALLLLFPADWLRALGLGEARVDSYLGQPLDVSIRLIEPAGGSLDSLTVAPALSSDYDRLGIPSDALSLGLDVTVDRRVDPPLIRVRSSREVEDPIVQVLIDARWSNGRVLREYTLFLDPPTVPVAPPIRRVDTEAAPRSMPAEPARQPEATRPRPAPAPAREAAPAPEPQPRPAAQPVERAPAAVRPNVVGPIAPGQTLWSIAYSWRPSSGMTMNQVMLAILDRNPQAFINGNANQLRRGAELTMPSSDEVLGIDAAEADRRMRAQMQAWQPGAAVAEVPVIADEAIPEVEVESEPEQEAPVDDVVHRLEVVPPEGEVDDEGPAVSEAELSEARARLSELEDQMYTEGLENDQFYRQIEEIRDAIEAREMAGLAIADEEMANLEARLRDAREARAAEAEMAAADAAASAEEATGDEVDAYFRQLEDELGAGEEVASEAPAETVDAEQGASDTDSTQQEASTTEPTMAEPAPMPVTDTGSGGLPAWIWAVLALVLAGGAGAFWWLRKRGASGDAAGPSAGVTGVDVEAARERVASNRDDLDAHLALLNTLAAEGDESAFSDALDGMYAVVDHDDDPRWQEALNLAVVNAPDHPLLTPPETASIGLDDDDDEGLDTKTREMLGILGGDDSSSGDDIHGSEFEDDVVAEASVFDQEDDDADSAPSREDRAEETLSDAIDMDLAALSDRLDDEPEAADDEAEATDSGYSFDFSTASEDESSEDQAEVSEPEVSIDAAENDEDDGLSLDLGAEDSGGLEDLGGDSLGGESLGGETLGGETLGGDSESSRSEDEGLPLDLDLGDEDDDLDAGDTLKLDEVDDTLKLDSEDTLQLDAEELATFTSGGNSDEDEGVSTGADETLDLSTQELAEETGNQELEAFLGRDTASGEEEASFDDDVEPSLEGVPEADDEEAPELSDDDAEVKLDLARAYLSMDDPDSARTLLEEIVNGGSRAKREQAQELLDDM
ncbi:FimV/HubP family polar landmark protein [Wenzhouxiangella marina]|nr:FimV/HubP family polar landmark protein [Wenzhouxiangella marina]MBB6085813.1 pilus assembly protein FimV [Wenzhouxiangella marina]